MPNWCSNYVSMTHDDAAMLERARTAFARGELLNEFIPCPQDLLDTIAGSYGDPEQQEALRLREASNLEKHGFRNWYDWSVAHWGTKWDIGSEEGAEIVGDVLQLTFDSAWSPPIEAYQRLEELGFAVEAFYYEPGMAFCGSWINGADEYIDIPQSSQEAAAVIPDEIDGIFDIVNNMAMWESEDMAE